MVKFGIKRGAPKGLLTVRLVFNPSKDIDKRMWKDLEEKAKENGYDINDFVKKILSEYLKKSR
jgi:ParB family chromosome partitioning protein